MESSVQHMKKTHICNGEAARWIDGRYTVGKGNVYWPSEYRPLPLSCSVCGSLHPDDVTRLVLAGWRTRRARHNQYKFYLHPPGALAQVASFLRAVGMRVKGLPPGSQIPGDIGMPPENLMPCPPAYTISSHFSERDASALQQAVTSIHRRKE